MRWRREHEPSASGVDPDADRSGHVAGQCAARAARDGAGSRAGNSSGERGSGSRAGAGAFDRDPGRRSRAASTRTGTRHRCRGAGTGHRARTVGSACASRSGTGGRFQDSADATKRGAHAHAHADADGRDACTDAASGSDACATSDDTDVFGDDTSAVSSRTNRHGAVA
jgi:hypothetical protein